MRFSTFLFILGGFMLVISLVHHWYAGYLQANDQPGAGQSGIASAKFWRNFLAVLTSQALLGGMLLQVRGQ